MGYRLVQNGVVVKKGRGRPSSGSQYSSKDVSDPDTVAQALSDINSRISSIESGIDTDVIEFDIAVPATGTVSLEHGFGCPIRWSVVSWKRNTNAGYWNLSEVNASSTVNTLVLTSKVSGQAIIRVEKSDIAGNRYNGTNEAIATASPTDIVFGAESYTATASWTRLGARKIDMSLYPGATTVRFLCDLESTVHSSAWSAEARLFDYTNNAAVSSTLTNSAEVDKSLTKEYSATLTVGTSSGNIRTDQTPMYEVQFRVNGTITDTDQQRAVIGNGRVLIS